MLRGGGHASGQEQRTISPREVWPPWRETQPSKQRPTAPVQQMPTHPPPAELQMPHKDPAPDRGPAPALQQRFSPCPHHPPCTQGQRFSHPKQAPQGLREVRRKGEGSHCVQHALPRCEGPFWGHSLGPGSPLPPAPSLLAPQEASPLPLTTPPASRLPLLP